MNTLIYTIIFLLLIIILYKIRTYKEPEKFVNEEDPKYYKLLADNMKDSIDNYLNRKFSKKSKEFIFFGIIDKLRALNVITGNTTTGQLLINELLKFEFDDTPGYIYFDLTDQDREIIIRDLFNMHENLLYIIYPDL
jgi:hypothetical protein